MKINRLFVVNEQRLSAGSYEGAEMLESFRVEMEAGLVVRRVHWRCCRLILRRWLKVLREPLRL